MVVAKKEDNYLIISDYHAPYGNKLALNFYACLKEDFNIPDDNVYNVGDFEDQFHFSSHFRSPDRHHTAIQEIEAVREEIKKWSKVFPKMKMCTSNHGSRLYKRAMEAELPSVILKGMREIYEYPKGWEIAEQFIICATKKEFLIFHGEGYSGIKGHIDAAMDLGISTAMGHLHGNGGVNHIRTRHQDLWAMNVGCSVDPESFAFEYGDKSRRKPTLGGGLVLDGGRLPLFIPMELK